MAQSLFARLFNSDKKILKKVELQAQQVDSYKEAMKALSDDELKAKTPYFKDLLAQGKSVDDILPEAYAVAREAAVRVIKEFPYFVQVMGAIVLHNGDVAEMKTGEGKTLTATMAVYLNALTGKGVHVVTVNEYLAQRDAEWMGAIYRFLGLTVGVNLRELTPEQKRASFQCDVTYTTNAEVGFDYLRDNMATDLNRRVLRPFYMAIIDEADSILIDESRTPLIISGGARQSANLYVQANRFARSLSETKHYEIDVKSKTIQLTEDGMHYAEKSFGIDNLYRLEYTSLVHHIHQALKANYIMQRDVDYVVQEGAVVIVDQFTGRLLKGRTFSDGLHQAIEAKEQVKINEETVTMATITYQNLFRLYTKLAGMTGTAKTEEEEFLSIYNMRVLPIPTNVTIARVDAIDYVYATKAYKYSAIVKEVFERHQAGQPVLLGTISVETSELLSKLLTQAGIPHEVLNAKNHAREAEIIVKAGQKGAVTIATNMAGRGTDIKLGEGVRELGGLCVIGSERHEARRIDNQLRGRSGRQGDPGYTRFYVSMEDELLVRFGTDRMKGTLERLGFGETPLEHRTFSKFITNAQTKIEGMNFDVRKTLIQYDDVLRQQREIMYKQRDAVLSETDVHNQVDDLFHRVADRLIDTSLNFENKEPIVDHEKLPHTVGTQLAHAGEIKPEDYRGLTVPEAKAKMYDFLMGKFLLKKTQWGDDIFRMVEKQVLIRIIDMNWTNHIDKMSKLRDGIHLRAYAQTNPLQSYINEGYDMFQDMVYKISYDTVVYCINTQIKIQPKATQPAPKKDEGVFQ